MARDADSPGRESEGSIRPGRQPADPDSSGRESGESNGPGRESTLHARTDRQSAGGSVDVAPETLYLTKIAVQQARIDALETAVQRQERDLQQVIDRYERLLTARAQTGEPLTDGGRDRDDAPDGIVGRVLADLRRRLP